MSGLNEAFGLLVDTFNEYARLEGDNNTLTKAELVDLLNIEFHDAPRDKVENLISELAAERDAVVTFQEFVAIVADFDLKYTNNSKLTQAMALLKETFEKYARHEGDSDTLTRRDLRYLLYKQFPDAPRDKAAIDSMLSKLDADGDGVVSFEEFLTIAVDFYAKITKE